MAGVNYSEGKPEMDLTGYEAQFTHNGMVWTWEVTTPNGDTLYASMGSGGREAAERLALAAMERHARQPAPMSGDELAEAVAAREAT